MRIRHVVEAYLVVRLNNKEAESQSLDKTENPVDTHLMPGIRLVMIVPSVHRKWRRERAASDPKVLTPVSGRAVNW